jgi:hypothetical protein
MRHVLSTLGFLVLLIAAVSAGAKVLPAGEGVAGQRAFDDLTTLYKDEKKVPPYEDALAQLVATDEAVRRRAGEYLLALFKQSKADESNGRTSWSGLPGFGQLPDCTATAFREHLAEDFGAQARGVEALPAALWLIDEERVPKNQAAGICALRAVKDPASAAVFARLLAQPHPNADVTVGVLEEIAARRLDGYAADIKRLAGHYRASVREAARDAATHLGIRDIPAYDPEKAFTPWLIDQIKAIRQMVRDEIPASARWMHFVQTYPETVIDGQPYTRTFDGWLLSEDAEKYNLVDWFGRPLRLEKKNMKASPRVLADEPAVFTAARNKDDRWGALDALSSSGGFTGQFESDAISLPETLVAAWAYERGDLKTAAATLFPRLDSMPDDRWMVEIPRDLLGRFYQQEMLDAFSHDRDYPAAISWAEHLSKSFFDGYAYQERAKELAAQLAKRKEDFKTFVLPTFAEWAEKKKGLGRAEQIRFLAERLRLLNCIQMSQPGEVRYEDEQSQKPRVLVRGWPTAEVTDPVVNPFNELKAMKLTVEDLRILAPFLADDNFMPTYSFWRDFHPARTLHRANWAMGKLLNSVAQRDLAELYVYEGLDADGRKSHLSRILAWCAANKDKTRDELLLATLADDASTWMEQAYAAQELAAEHNLKALPLLIKQVEDIPDKAEILVECCYELDASKVVPEARRWVKSPDEGVRFWAAIILLAHGDTAKLEGLDILRPILENKGSELWLENAIDPLCRTHREECLKLACLIFERRPYGGPVAGGEPALHRLFLAGRKECLDWLLANLDNDKETWPERHETIGGKEQRRTGTEGDETAEIVAGWRNDAYRYDFFGSEDHRRKQRAELKAWLQQQFKRIAAGEKPDMRDKPNPIQAFRWRAESP